MSTKILDRPRVRFAVTIGCVLALSWMGYSFFGNRPASLKSTLDFVCIETGKQFTISRKDANFIPLKNPDTGRRSLFPVDERAGSLFIPERYREVVTQFSEKGGRVDPTSLAVKTN